MSDKLRDKEIANAENAETNVEFKSKITKLTLTNTKKEPFKKRKEITGSVMRRSD